MLETVYIGSAGNRDRLQEIRINSRLGIMATPFDYRNRNMKHALDNGAFTAYIHGTCFDDYAFLLALSKATNPDFVILPDIVAGGKKSLNYSIVWRNFLPDKFTYYLAVQDGMTITSIPDAILPRIGGIFVGGTMKWKYETAESWVNYAHRHSKKLHIGRAGTLKSILWADRIGADSIDSSNFAQHDKNWHELLQWLRGEHKPLTAQIFHRSQRIENAQTITG